MPTRTLPFRALKEFSEAIEGLASPQFLRAVEGDLARMLARRLPDSLRKAVPRRSGRLAAGFVGNVSGNTVNMRNSAPYAPFVRFRGSGKRVGDIVFPEARKLLKSRGPGEFARTVARFKRT